MESAKLDRLGRAAYSRSIHPIKRLPRLTFPILGFDTEYTSNKNNLICYQIYGPTGGILVSVRSSEKLTPAKIYKTCCTVLGETPRDILLVTYFSLAELQFLKVRTEGLQVREYARGSLDVSFHLSKNGAQIHIFDLMRFFDGRGLAAAAESFGLEKKEMKVTKVTRAHLKSKKFKEYALHDAYLCREIAIRLQRTFIDATEIDPLIMKTPASTSQAAFRRRCIKQEMYCDNNRARYAALRGYRGGHAEVFERGRLKGTFTEWDFKSAYPAAVLKIGVFPIQKTWRSFDKWTNAKKLKGGFVEVDFHFPKDERYPFLPVDVDDGTIYPREGHGWVTLQEAQYARSVGAKVRLYQGYGYIKGTTALTDYFQWCIEQRAKAKGAAKVMYKLLANSLTGKFVQAITKIDVETCKKIAEIGGYYLDEVLQLDYSDLITLAEGLEIKCHASVGPVFMPEWSGLITGYTRTALAQMIRTSDAVYCHTDSVWSRKRPKCELLPFEKKVTGPVTIIRRAFACIGEPVTDKGLKAGTCHAAMHSIWTRTAALQMLNKFDGEDFSRKYPVKRPVKFREAVKSHRPGGKKLEPGIWVKEWRTGNTRWDDKRRLLASGLTVPWESVGDYMRRGDPIDPDVQGRNG